MNRKVSLKTFLPFAAAIIALAILGSAIAIDVCVQINISFNFELACNASITILTIVFTIWFSYLLAMKQIYQKNHEKETVKKVINEGRLVIISNFIVLFLFGIALSILGNTYVVTNISYCVLCFVYLVFCAKNLYSKVESSELSVSISNRAKQIISKIDSDDIKAMNANLKEINQVYDECFYRSDSYSCKEIIKVYTEFLRNHLIKINEKILKNGNEDVEKFNSSLCSSIIRLFKNENSDLAISTNRQIIIATSVIAQEAIKCNNLEVLKNVLKIYEKFTADNEPFDAVYYDDLYRVLTYILIKAVKDNRKELFDLIMEAIGHVQFSLEITKGYNNIQLLCNLFISSLYAILLENNDDSWEYYQLIHNHLADLIFHATKFKDAEYPCLMLQAYITDEEFCKNHEAQKLYFDLLDTMTNTRNTYANIETVKFINNSLQFYADKNFGELPKIRNLQFILAYNSLRFIEEVSASLMPDFKEFVKGATAEENKTYSQYCKDLVVQCISKNRLNNLKVLLHDLVDILSTFKQEQKELQRTWMSVFYLAFNQASHDDSIYELILYMYINTIREMDKNRTISEKLSLEVISELRYLCVGRYRENVDFVCEVVELLDRLASKDENLYFVSYYRMSKKIYSCISDVGVDGIEKNQPLVIKRVSNLIGWRLYEAIKNNEADLAKQLLGTAFTLFELCRLNLPNDQQTIVFVGTLFVIIGAYCKVNKKMLYLNNIVEFLKKQGRVDYIDISRRLRQNSGDDWDILGSDPNGAMNEFMKLLK